MKRSVWRKAYLLETESNGTKFKIEEEEVIQLEVSIHEI